MFQSETVFISADDNAGSVDLIPYQFDTKNGTKITAENVVFDPDELEEGNCVLTLKAMWEHNEYKATFYHQDETGEWTAYGEDTPQKPQSPLYYGDKVEKPEDPEVTGYTLTGWFKDKECTSEWKFDTDTVGEGDVDLYAQFTINKHKVIFSGNEPDEAGTATGVPEIIENVEYGSTVAKPETEPELAGYVFSGWYKEKECENEWSFADAEIPDTTPDADVTLYAKWLKKYTVTFYDGDTPYGEDTPQKPQKIISGEYIDKPENPTKAGAIFDTWYKEPECQNAWDFSTDTMPEADLNLYAKFTFGSYKVIYHRNGAAGDDIFMEKSYENPVDVAIILQEPVWENTSTEYYTFDGWNPDKDAEKGIYTATGKEGTSSTITLVNPTTHLYAIWEKIDIDFPWVDYEHYEYNAAKEYRMDHLNGWEFNKYIDFDGTVGGGVYEKFNIPIRNLVPGTWYVITFSEDMQPISKPFNADRGTYGNTVRNKVDTRGDRSTQIGGTVNGDPNIGVWRHDWYNYSSYTAKSDQTLTFKATAETMYWIWDLSKINDTTKRTYHFSNSSITPIKAPVAESVDFLDATYYQCRITSGGGDNEADLKGIATFKTNAKYDDLLEIHTAGNGRNMKLNIPLINLTAGNAYKLDFSYKRTGSDLKKGTDKFGYFISDSEITDNNDYTANAGFQKNISPEFDGSIVFDATADTMYWVWQMTALQSAAYRNDQFFTDAKLTRVAGIEYFANTTDPVTDMPENDYKTITSGKLSFDVANDNTVRDDGTYRYTLLGWSTDPTATSAEYKADDKIETDKVVRLYAVWSKESVTVAALNSGFAKFKMGSNTSGTTAAGGAFPSSKKYDITGMNYLEFDLTIPEDDILVLDDLVKEGDTQLEITSSGASNSKEMTFMTYNFLDQVKEKGTTHIVIPLADAVPEGDPAYKGPADLTKINYMRIYWVKNLGWSGQLANCSIANAKFTRDN